MVSQTRSWSGRKNQRGVNLPRSGLLEQPVRVRRSPSSRGSRASLSF